MMAINAVVAAAMAAAMLSMSVSLFAAEQAAPKSEPIYGYRMMDEAERNAYREKMRNAKSADERQAIRDEHRKLMEARAKERGVTLPEPRGPRGVSQGAGPRGDCPAGQECPGPRPGAGKGAATGPGGGPGWKGEGKGPGSGPGWKGEGKGPGYGPGAGKGPGPRP
jgi:hypothetical protein